VQQVEQQALVPTRQEQEQAPALVQQLLQVQQQEQVLEQALVQQLLQVQQLMLLQCSTS
jgi:hypothetical protein